MCESLIGVGVIIIIILFIYSFSEEAYQQEETKGGASNYVYAFIYIHYVLHILFYNDKLTSLIGSVKHLFKL